MRSIEAAAEVAQLVEHSTENAGVASSILALGTLKTRQQLAIGRE